MQIDLSENIRRYRKQLGLTQEQLAEALNVTVGAVSKWETGLNTPDLAAILQLAALFGTSVDALLGYTVQSESARQLAEQLQALCQGSSFDQALPLAERALLKYPNHFDVVYRSAILYSLHGFSAHNPGSTRRAQQLFEHSLALVDQSTDEQLNRGTIQKRLIQTHIQLGETEQALQQLRQTNANGVNNGEIGELLAGIGQYEQAMPYLTESVLDHSLQLVRVCISYANCFEKTGSPRQALELLLWLNSLLDGLKTPDTPCYPDKLQAAILAACASLYDAQDDRPAAEAALRKALLLARRFDAAPDYTIRGVRFYHGKAGTAHDDLGRTAQESVHTNFLEGSTGSAAAGRQALLQHLEQAIEETEAPL